MEEITSKVYVMTDDQSRIIRCEGGYTTPSDLTGWMQIDEGTGDRYNLCQTHYFPDSIYTQDGVPRYKLRDGKAVSGPRRRSPPTGRRCRRPRPRPRNFSTFCWG